MNDSITRISLDIHSTSSKDTVNAKRGDTARKIIISLVDGGIPYIISDDCHAVFTAKKPDGNVVYNDCTIENNTIIYKFTEQTVAVEGRVNSEIKLYGADDKLITSPKFTIAVFGTVYDEGDEIESSDEFNALTRLVSEAMEATENANKAAEKAAHTAKALMVVGEADGEAIHFDDAIEQYLVGCRIFGKTMQGGTPTPDAPVDMVSVAESGSLSLFVTGKNLFTGWTVGGINPDSGTDYVVATQRRTPYIPIFSPGQKYNISNIPGTLYSFVAFYDAAKTFIRRSAAAPYSFMLVEPPENAKYFRLTVYENKEVTGKIAEADAMASTTMIEAGNAITAYVRGQPIQSAVLSTPNGLRGIPVSSGGNYTDSNGQQWICDEIDFARGVYIKRVARNVYDGSSDEYWTEYGGADNLSFYVWPSTATTGSRLSLCDRFENVVSAWSSSNATKYGIYSDHTSVIGKYFRAPNESVKTLAQWNAWLAENPITLIYVMATPVETPLTEEELAAYAALHTYKDHTTVSNSGHAYMELEYVMDAKKYIDRIIGSAGGGASAGIINATVE